LEGSIDPIDGTGLGRKAALVALVALAALLAADLVVMKALFDRAANLNELGRMLAGTGDASVVKLVLLTGLIAIVLRRRTTGLRLLCAVWAVTGVYVTVVLVNAYTLRVAAAGAG
jgi:hypothetical protein